MNDFSFACLDTQRERRRGIPEVIWSEGKSSKQLIAIARKLHAKHNLVLITRLAPDVFAAVHQSIPRMRYDSTSRIGYLCKRKPRRLRGYVAVVTAGTADIRVAEEALLTLELLGSRCVRLYDVGVAGVHRLLDQSATLQKARVVVVAAGMEAALASVVAGLVSCPIVAVPTSVGYGASFQGVAALLTMLNSCSPGIGVVNIDNGFGAGYLAHTIGSRA